MSLGYSYFIVVLLISLLPFAGLILLQIFLSKKESRWLGLILPVITFCVSLAIILGITGGANILSVAGIIATFLFINIPTAVFLVIMGVFRSGRKKNAELNKMNIQDL
jgi:NADH:ubiquinone oxidoreductase subunit 5 (subunit L)/multisubunit Na+/H+ antiporter MnhA subunit